MGCQQWVCRLAFAFLAGTVSAQPPAGSAPGPLYPGATGPIGALPAQYAALAASGESIPPQFAALAASGKSIPPQYAALAASGQSIPPQFAALAALEAIGGGSPSQAPMGAETPQSQDGDSLSDSDAYNTIPLAPYIDKNNLDVPDTFLLLQQVFRFIGDGLTPVDNKLRDAIQESFQGFLTAGASLNDEFDIASIVESTPAPSVYCCGLQPNSSALAPSPVGAQQAPALSPYGGRRLLQEASSPPITADPDLYTSVDVTLNTYVHYNSTFLQVNQPSQLVGFIAVSMLQAGYQVQVLALGYHYGPDAVPLVKLLPLRPLYILESVLELVSPGLTVFTLGEQNQLLLAANSLLASQQAYEWNVILDTWINPNTSTVRTVLKSYVTQNLTSIDQVLGGNFGALLQQRADAAGADVPVNLTLVSSVQVGTLMDEVSGNLQNVDPAPSAAETTVNSGTATGGGLSTGAIVGIVIGGVAAAAILAVLAGLLFMRRRKRLQNPFAASQQQSRWPFWVSDSDAMIKGGAGETASSMDKAGMHGELSQPRYTSVPLSESLIVSKAHMVALEGSSETLGSGSADQSCVDSVKEMFMQKEVWNIEPGELQVYKLPDGSDWLLGTGSFGQVFRGIRSGVQDVAIKRLLQPDVLHLRLFQREIALLRLLNYDRNVVQFYGACLAEGNLMLVCEYMEGGDLRDALGDDDTGELDWYNGGASLLMDIARGLHFLHINKVVHRDLKTKNILLTAGNKSAKIGDIGLAKLMGSQLMSSTANTAGTFAYAAPELLLGDNCDVKADIYSFGVVIWEVVTHEVPIRGALRHVKVPEECPQEVADIIDSCLLSDPAQRPSAKDVYDALRTLVSPTIAPSASLALTPLPAVEDSLPRS